MNFKHYLEISERILLFVESRFNTELEELVDELKVLYGVDPDLAVKLIQQSKQNITAKSIYSVEKKINEHLKTTNISNYQVSDKIKNTYMKIISKYSRKTIKQYTDILVNEGVIDIRKLTRGVTKFDDLWTSSINSTEFKSISYELIKKLIPIKQPRIGEGEFALTFLTKNSFKSTKNGTGDFIANNYAFEVKAKSGTILVRTEEARKLQKYFITNVKPRITDTEMLKRFSVVVEGNKSTGGRLFSYFMLEHRPKGENGDFINDVFQSIGDKTFTINTLKDIAKILNVNINISRVVLSNGGVDTFELAKHLTHQIFDIYQNSEKFNYLLVINQKQELIVCYKDSSSFKPVNGVVDFNVQIQIKPGGGRNGVNLEFTTK